MQSPSRTILISAFLLFYGSKSLAQSCLANFDTTFSQARAVLRAHNCQRAGSLEACDTHLGVGPLAAGVAAATLGGAAALKVRNPNFAVCAIAQIPWWIEYAHAQSSCMKADLHSKIIASNYNDKVIAKYKALIDTQKQAIEMASKSVDSKAAITELESSRQKIQAEIQNYTAESIDWGSNRDISKMRNQQQSSLSRAYQEYFKLTGSYPEGPEDLKALATEQGRKKFNISQAQSKSILGHLNQYEDFDKKIAEFKVGASSLANDNKYKNLQRQLLDADQKLEQMKKLSAQASSQSKPSPRALEAMKLRLADLEKNLDAATGLKKVLHPSNVLSPDELSTSLDILRDISTPPGGLTPRIVDSNLLKTASLMAPKNSSPSLFSNALAKIKTGKIKKGIMGVLTAGAINTGLMTAASAASLEDAADALDPLSALVHMKENGCGSTLDSIKYKIFPVTPETKCYPDFKINASNIQFLNMDKDELRAAIQEAPEICDFIYWNHKKLYPSVKATCGPEGATARFNDGSSMQISQNRISYFAGTSTKTPTVMEYFDGKEARLRTPRLGGIVSESSIDLLKEDEDDLQEYLDEFYKGRLAVISEVRACCQPNGMGLDAHDCSRYGIQKSSASGSSSKSSKGSR